jgi:TRAP transporter TAXI family solute receptor
MEDMTLKPLNAFLSSVAVMAVGTTSAYAQERITLKSAASTSSYYAMMVQLAEMLQQDNAFLPTVEESQGSVQNVKESKVRPGNFLFTTPPSLLDAAREGKDPFEGDAFDNARTLFVMPFVTIHFVASADSGIESMQDFAGKKFIAGGTGTFCEGRTKTILGALGLLDSMELVEVQETATNPAMRNGQVDGFSDCSAHPSTGTAELAATMDLKFIPLTDEERDQIIALDPLSGPLTIAGGTYKGQDAEISTVGVPVGAYGTTNMSDSAAYEITKTFWENKDKLAADQPWWQGVTPDLVSLLGAQAHPGAKRYYDEVGVQTPE